METRRKRKRKITSHLKGFNYVPFIYTTSLNNMSVLNQDTEYMEAVDVINKIEFESKPKYNVTVRKFVDNKYKLTFNEVNFKLNRILRNNHVKNIYRRDFLRSKEKRPSNSDDDNINLPFTAKAQQDDSITIISDTESEDIPLQGLKRKASNEVLPERPIENRKIKINKAGTNKYIVFEIFSSLKMEIYHFDDNDNLIEILNANVCDHNAILSDPSNSSKYVYLKVCCWYKREMWIVNYLSTFISLKKLRYLQKPHPCRLGQCSCCCKKITSEYCEIEEKSTQEVKPLLQLSRYCENITDVINEENIQCVFNLIYKAVSFVKYKKCATHVTNVRMSNEIMHKTKVIEIFNKMKNQMEYYEYSQYNGLCFIARSRPTKTYIKTPQKQMLYGFKILAIRHLCCWNNLNDLFDELLSHEKFHYNLIKFLKVPHSCSSQNCICCCKIQHKSITSANGECSQSTFPIKCPNLVVRHTRFYVDSKYYYVNFDNRNDLPQHEVFVKKNIIIDNDNNRKTMKENVTTDNGKTYYVPCKNEILESVTADTTYLHQVPIKNEIEEDVTTDNANTNQVHYENQMEENAITDVDITYHAPCKNEMIESDSVKVFNLDVIDISLMRALTDKFRDIKFTVLNGKVSAHLNCPVNQMLSPIELSVLTHIVQHAQKNINYNCSSNVSLDNILKENDLKSIVNTAIKEEKISLNKTKDRDSEIKVSQDSISLTNENNPTSQKPLGIWQSLGNLNNKRNIHYLKYFRSFIENNIKCNNETIYPKILNTFSLKEPKALMKKSSDHLLPMPVNTVPEIKNRTSNVGVQTEDSNNTANKPDVVCVNVPSLNHCESKLVPRIPNSTLLRVNSSPVPVPAIVENIYSQETPNNFPENSLSVSSILSVLGCEVENVTSNHSFINKPSNPDANFELRRKKIIEKKNLGGGHEYLLPSTSTKLQTDLFNEVGKQKKGSDLDCKKEIQIDLTVDPECSEYDFENDITLYTITKKLKR